MKLRYIFVTLTICMFGLFINGCHNEKDNTKLQACFTPGENCTEGVVNALNQAKKSVFIQASAFSNDPIIKAIVAAKQRNVAVHIIFDKSLWTAQNTAAAILLENKIPVSLDKKVVLAHNNVMIIDNHKVITGSFDFTHAAQEKNAENLLIVENAAIGKRYADNWQSRMVLAEAVTELPKAEKTVVKSNHGRNHRYRAAKDKRKQKNSGFWPFN